MANTKKAAVKKETVASIDKPRRVSIPAGQIHTLHYPDDRVYVISDGKWPDALAIMFKEAQGKSYDEGFAAGKHAANDKQLAANSCGSMARAKQPEEAAQEILSIIYQMGATPTKMHDTLAKVIRGMREYNTNMMNHAQQSMDSVKAHFDMAKETVADFENVVANTR